MLRLCTGRVVVAFPFVAGLDEILGRVQLFAMHRLQGIAVCGRIVRLTLLLALFVLVFRPAVSSPLPTNAAAKSSATDTLVNTHPAEKSGSGCAGSGPSWRLWGHGHRSSAAVARPRAPTRFREAIAGQIVRKARSVAETVAARMTASASARQSVRSKELALAELGNLPSYTERDWTLRQSRSAE